VIPRFKDYAPGLDTDRSECAIHAVDVRRGTVLGSLAWPRGNQIFAIDWAPKRQVSGFPFSSRRGSNSDQVKKLLYSFQFNGASNS
jgi:hypothetical protein